MTVSMALNLRRVAVGATLVIAAATAGCSNDGSPGLFATGALSDTKTASAAKAAVDPACVTLSAQIDKLHQDGAVDRLEKAADGKTADVKVKRTSLATQAQLNKANADFIAKCGPSMPKSAMAAPAVAPVAAAVAQAPSKVAQIASAKAPTAATAAKDAGVTVVSPAGTADAPVAPKN